MARRTLAQHWKSLVPREQHEFVRLFREILAESFVTIVQRHAGDAVPALDEKVTGAFAQVRSRLVPEDGPGIAVEYRLSRSGSQWTVYDIVFDGASLVAHYRGQFNSIIGTAAVAGLLDRMRTERSRRAESGDAAGRAATAELRASTPERLAAGLLLGAVSPRWR